MANKVLLTLAHPALQNSIVNKSLIDIAAATEGVTINDLYETYYDFNVNIKQEQALLIQHDILVFQHPIHWYSSPALLKQWIDLVLEHNFAYGPKGTALAGKKWLSIVTTGGARGTYEALGANRFSLREFMRPFEQTAKFCGMDFLPPYVVFGTHRLKTNKSVHEISKPYQTLLDALVTGTYNFEAAADVELYNDNAADIIKLG